MESEGAKQPLHLPEMLKSTRLSLWYLSKSAAMHKYMSINLTSSADFLGEFALNIKPAAPPLQQRCSAIA